MRRRLSRARVIRIAPFALFMVLLALRANVPIDNSWGFDRRWIYPLTVIAVGALLLHFRREYGELVRQLWPDMRETLLAVATGAAVFVLWINLDAPWMQIGEPVAFIPPETQDPVEWLRVAIRLIGATLLVPVMEELFWRSFLMRWIEQARFETVDPRRVGLKAVVLTTFMFMLAHTLWLAAIVAGLAYTWLYMRTGKLWLPIIAHAVTNGMLGVWILLTGNWQFW